MAKLESSTPAPIGDLQTVSSNVSAAAEGMSRRQAMNMMTAVAAVPALALQTTPAWGKRTVDRRAWDTAVARLRAAEAEYERFGERQTAAHDAAEAACPREDHWFSRYDLGVYKNLDEGHERNIRAAQVSLVIERAYGRQLSDEEARQVSADAERIVDDFEAYCARHKEAFREYDILQERFDALVDQRERARDAVLAATAPDQQALRLKIEVLATMMREADVEDADRIGAVLGDAKHLLH